MQDLDKALADINAIRIQMARGTEFRGYGPATVAMTGLLAPLAAAVQAWWLPNPAADVFAYLALWVVTAAVSILLIGAEMVARTRRIHSGLADEMIHAAIEQFVPAGVAGVLLTFVLWRFAPHSLWMLPGLWQLLVSLGISASARSLPRSVMLGAAWYFVAGFVTLMLASENHALSPWTMGLPFVGGQFLMAAILHFASGELDGED